MYVINTNVVERHISVDRRDVLQGGSQVDTLEVTFDDEWRGFDIRACFVRPDMGETRTAAIAPKWASGSDVSGPAEVAMPASMIAKTGTLVIAFVGVSGERKMTTHADGAYLTVVDAGWLEGSGTGTVEPEIGDLEKARQQAVEAADAASDATDAANRAKADADSATRAAQDATAAASRAADSANGAASAATASKDAADVATGDARAATRAANDAAQAALSAVTADRKVWLDYDEDGYLSIYEVRS